MSPRKFVKGSAQPAKVYTGGVARRSLKEKRVIYKCGCEVILGDYREGTAPATCANHPTEPIVEIVTRERFED